MDFTPLLQRKNELGLAYAIEPNPKAAFALRVRWAEVCHMLNLLGYQEPETTTAELLELINSLED